MRSRPVASDTKTSTDRRPSAVRARIGTLSAVAPPPALRLAEVVGQRGGRAFLVGGGVRDHLLGTPCKDFDIEVFGLEMDALGEVLSAHGRVNAVGRSFGVWKWRPPGVAPGEELDVSVPRRDSKVGPGHRGIAVEGDPTMSPEEAARRRDLTVNALMYDLADDQVVDPHGGLDDLVDGMLRAVDEDTFLEDPLRALRVVQFAARLGFDVADDLVELCRRARLAELPAERIQGEWAKLLLRSPLPSVGLDVARRTNVLDRVFPEVAHLRTDRAVDQAASVRAEIHPAGRQWAVMLLAWLSPASTADLETTLDRLWLHTWQGYPLRRAATAAHDQQNASVHDDAALRRLSVRAEVELVLRLRQANDHDIAAPWAAAQRLGVLHAPPDRLLLGRHLKGLGIPPGRHMGELLAEVYEAQLEGAVTTLEEAMDRARELWKRASTGPA